MSLMQGDFPGGGFPAEKGGHIRTTGELRQTIEDALSFLPASGEKEAVKNPCQRTFQALRIDVNSEFEGSLCPDGKASTGIGAQWKSGNTDLPFRGGIAS